MLALALAAALFFVGDPYPTWGEHGPPGSILLLGLGVGIVVGLAVTWRLYFPRYSHKGASQFTPWVNVAYAVLGLWAAWTLFEVPNGALDLAPATQRSYEVVSSEAVGDPRCSDDEERKSDPQYRLRARDPDTPAEEREIAIYVGCDDVQGLPVDDGFVPVGQEVIVDVKPGFLGTPWRGGWRVGPR